MGKMKNCMVVLLVSLSCIWLCGCDDMNVVSPEKIREKIIILSLISIIGIIVLIWALYMLYEDVWGKFTPAWNNKNPGKRKKAVWKIKSIRKLQKVTVEANYEDVQIETWKCLAERCKNFENKKKRNLRNWIAEQKITNQKILAIIALKFTDDYLRKEAVKKLDDQKVLTKVAQTDSSYSVREEAVKKLDEKRKTIIFAGKIT